ncbi:MAG TPA: glycosyltransferase [Pyrinomonadaceae bacterium]|jgi:glycosyltransferase involved in cell wall biosynthesis
MTAVKSETGQKPSAREARAARRLWFKERVYESRALQQLYASWGDVQARLALLRGQPYEAARRMFHIWRHLGTEGIGPARIARIQQLLQEHCYLDGQLLPASENGLRLDFLRSEKGRELRKLYGAFPLEHRARLRFPRPDPDPERQGDLVVLKPYDPQTGERGVLMVMYSEGILALTAVFDLGALASKYMFVLEPSSWGYQEVRFFLYLGADLDVLVQSPRRADFEFIESLGTNLAPVRVGAGDWVDPATFRPREVGQKATYDVVMVAAWDPLKRHEVFFRAAARLKQEQGRTLRIALIGYTMGWTRRVIEELLKQYGLDQDCDLFEMIPHAEVARIVADSKVSLLLSKQEGANRAIYESMFCGTPIIVYKQNCGSNLDHVNQWTGLLADDEELGEAITRVLDHAEDFDPRGWALRNVGYENATKNISEALREMAQRRGLPWTLDIATKKNAPNLRYGQPGLYKDFEEEYQRLQAYLLPLD